jgi:hypothetical protein
MTCPFLETGRCRLAESHALEELDLQLECRPTEATCSECLQGNPREEKPTIQCVGLVTAQVTGEHLSQWRRYIGWTLFGKSRGRGDTIAKITKATGIATVVKAAAKAVGKDCGCKKRQKKQNAAHPYGLSHSSSESAHEKS